MPPVRRGPTVVVELPPFDPDRPVLWKERCRLVSRTGGRLCVNVPLDSNKGGKRAVYADYVRTLTEAGWRYQTTIIWNEQNIVIENIDWTREPDGTMRHERVLTNKVAFGSAIWPKRGGVEMELWLRNGSEQPLPGLRTQICNLLKGAPDFNEQTTTNKILRAPIAAVRSATGDRWILTAWERCGRAWGHPLVPCLHADPVLPDCAPGETVRVRGRLWFYEGSAIDQELERARAEFEGGGH